MAYYYKHPDLSLPEDASVIWRYMDLWKFQSMIHKNSIFFSRADKQDDKLEGKYPESILAELDREHGFKILSKDGNTYTLSEWHIEKEIRSRLISCWSLGPSETKKMWNTYTKCRNSIAVRSTIESLKNCFHDKIDDRPVWIGKVRYGEEENKLPRQRSNPDLNFWLYPFFAKKNGYSWENEIRATVNIALSQQGQFDNNPYGCHIKADLKILIDSVWINPQSPPEFKYQVSACLDKYSFGNVEIYQSLWDCLPCL